MSPGLIILFLVCAVLLLLIVYALWRYWQNLANISPEQEAYDKRVASLNERQAHRLSDEQLTQPVSEDDAWRAMLERGQRAQHKRNRYAGDLRRRIRERRRL